MQSVLLNISEYLVSYDISRNTQIQKKVCLEMPLSFTDIVTANRIFYSLLSSKEVTCQIEKC